MEGGKRAINNNEVATFDHASAKVSTGLRKAPDMGPLGWYRQSCEVAGVAALAGSHGWA